MHEWCACELNKARMFSQSQPVCQGQPIRSFGEVENREGFTRTSALRDPAFCVRKATAPCTVALLNQRENKRPLSPDRLRLSTFLPLVVFPLSVRGSSANRP